MSEQEQTEIRFDFNKLPPSVNSMYRVCRGKVILSRGARDWKERFLFMKGGADLRKLKAFKETADPNRPWQLHIWFLLPRGRLFTKTKRAKSKFKNVDTSNMVKIAEDGIEEIVEIIDKANFSVLLHKRPSDMEGLVAILKPLDLEEDPYPIPEKEADYGPY